MFIIFLLLLKLPIISSSSLVLGSSFGTLVVTYVYNFIFLFKLHMIRSLSLVLGLCM